MTDKTLVERLRGRPEFDYQAQAERREAADTIEELCDRIEALEASNDRLLHKIESLSGDLLNVRAENKRLYALIVYHNLEERGFSISLPEMSERANERLRALYEAVATVAEHECDDVIHPQCWERIMMAYRATGQSPAPPKEES